MNFLRVCIPFIPNTQCRSLACLQVSLSVGLRSLQVIRNLFYVSLKETSTPQGKRRTLRVLKSSRILKRIFEGNISPTKSVEKSAVVMNCAKLSVKQLQMHSGDRFLPTLPLWMKEWTHLLQWSSGALYKPRLVRACPLL